MSQTRLGSLIEANTGTAVGFIISFALQQWLIAPIFYPGNNSPEKNFLVTLIFTIASVLRSYAVRRYFNWRLTK